VTKFEINNFVPKTHRFWDIWLRKISWFWNPGLRLLKAIESGSIRYTVYGFLLVFSNMHHFWDIRLQKLLWPWNTGQRSLKVIGTDTDRSATYDFLLTFICWQYYCTCSS